jgi:hypothetical protein
MAAVIKIKFASHNFEVSASNFFAPKVESKRNLFCASFKRYIGKKIMHLVVLLKKVARGWRENLLSFFYFLIAEPQRLPILGLFVIPPFAVTFTVY